MLCPLFISQSWAFILTNTHHSLLLSAPAACKAQHKRSANCCTFLLFFFFFLQCTISALVSFPSSASSVEVLQWCRDKSSYFSLTRLLTGYLFATVLGSYVKYCCQLPDESFRCFTTRPWRWKWSCLNIWSSLLCILLAFIVLLCRKSWRWIHFALILFSFKGYSWGFDGSWTYQCLLFLFFFEMFPK